jgi:hypothetical protein
VAGRFMIERLIVGRRMANAARREIVGALQLKPSGLHSRLFLAIASGVFLASCFLPTESAFSTGHYALVRFGVDPIPVQLYELPSRQGQPTGCWYTLTDGFMELAKTPNTTFAYTNTYRNSCDGSVLFVESANGAVAQIGDSLSFTVTGVNNSFSFPGRLRQDTVIVVLDASHIYYFKRVVSNENSMGQ